MIEIFQTMADSDRALTIRDLCKTLSKNAPEIVPILKAAKMRGLVQISKATDRWRLAGDRTPAQIVDALPRDLQFPAAVLADDRPALRAAVLALFDADPLRRWWHADLQDRLPGDDICKRELSNVLSNLWRGGHCQRFAINGGRYFQYGASLEIVERTYKANHRRRRTEAPTPAAPVTLEKDQTMPAPKTTPQKQAAVDEAPAVIPQKAIADEREINPGKWEAISEPEPAAKLAAAFDEQTRFAHFAKIESMAQIGFAATCEQITESLDLALRDSDSGGQHLLKARALFEQITDYRRSVEYLDPYPAAPTLRKISAMGIFGWSYPPGAANDPNAPFNEDCGDWYYCAACENAGVDGIATFEQDEADATGGKCPTCGAPMVSGETDQPYQAPA